MIRLHQYPPVWRLPSLSPFCIKVETYLRMTGTPFEPVIENNPLKGPRGRMPFIVEQDRIVSDSRLILEDLEARSPTPLDKHLTDEEKATSFAFHRMLDQDLIRVVLYSRWSDPQGWSVLKEEFKPFFPTGIRSLALWAIRRSLLLEARGSAITEFSRDEVYSLGRKHLTALSAFLGEKEFLFGDRPTTLDAAAFAFLFVILETPIDVPLRQQAKLDVNLTAYCERIYSQFFIYESRIFSRPPDHWRPLQ